MNYIQKFLNCFDWRAQYGPNAKQIIDHGDHDARFVSQPVISGGRIAKPPASLERFRSSYHGSVDSTHFILTSIISPDEAAAIDRAADLAFMGRWGEAEQWRGRGGYGGLGIIDDGPVSYDCEESRKRFNDLLDDDDY